MTNNEKLTTIPQALHGSNDKSYRLPTDTGETSGIITVHLNPNEQAHENEEIILGVMMMNAAEFDFELNEIHLETMKEACKRHRVTVDELYTAYWHAIADQFAPSSGLRFRHFYKHINREYVPSYYQSLD